jgi:hypothetical protein
VRGDPDVFAVVEVAESQELKKLVIGKIEAPTSPSIRSFSRASPHTELVRHVTREASMKRGQWRSIPMGKEESERLTIFCQGISGMGRA